MGQGELDFGVVELLDVVPLAESSRDDGSLDDLDAREPHSVPRAHLLHRPKATMTPMHAEGLKKLLVISPPTPTPHQAHLA